MRMLITSTTELYIQITKTPFTNIQATSMKILLCIFLFSALLISSTPVLAHPGRTDSSGYHTCRTNCPSYGLDYGEYHTHTSSRSRNSYSNTYDYSEKKENDSALGWWISGLAIIGLIGYLVEKIKK